MGYRIIGQVPWWTPSARAEQIEKLDDGSSCGGQWSYNGPCGGCAACMLAQESHYYHKGFAGPTLAAHEFMLAFWPVLTYGWVNDGTMASFPESHEISHWGNLRCRAPARPLVT